MNTQPEYDQHGYAPHGYLDKKVKVTTTSSPVTHHHYGTTTHPVSYPPTSSMPTATKGYTTEGYKQASTRSYGKVLTTEAPLVADDSKILNPSFIQSDIFTEHVYMIN